MKHHKSPAARLSQSPESHSVRGGALTWMERLLGRRQYAKRRQSSQLALVPATVEQLEERLLLTLTSLPNGNVFDDVTGYEWLHMSETDGPLSYNDIESQLGPNGQFEGWSFGTRAQVLDMFASGGLTNLPAPPGYETVDSSLPADLDTALDIASKLGITHSDPPNGSTGVLGFTADADTRFANDQFVVQLLIFDNSTISVIALGNVPRTSENPSFASFLYRPAPGIVVPNSFETFEGTFSTDLPFNEPQIRYQQVYNASEFSTLQGPTEITGIAFRPDASNGGIFSQSFANLQVNLSTTSGSADALSTTFSANVGADDTVVYSGPLTLSSNFIGPAGGPKEFDAVINFATPFTYDSSQGNLLLDIRKFSSEVIGQQNGMDAVNVMGDSVSRLTSQGNTNASSGTPTSHGLITKFFVEAQPAQPDIVATDLSIDGNSVNFGWRIDDADLPADTTVALYWSDDATFDASDTLAMSAPIQITGAGREIGSYSDSVTRSEVFQRRSGESTLLYVVDPPTSATPTGEVSESDESNNVIVEGTSDLSGAHWVSRFQPSRSVDDLEDSFQARVEAFIAAVTNGGATVSIDTTLRPPQRQYLIRWSWKIAFQDYPADQVPAFNGVDIEWWHGDQGRSRAAALEMVRGYRTQNLRVEPAPAGQSNHQRGLAIDMSITWSGSLTVIDANQNVRTIQGGPRDSTNAELIDIGRTFGVIHFVDVQRDRDHWSVDGSLRAATGAVPFTNGAAVSLDDVHEVISTAAEFFNPLIWQGIPVDVDDLPLGQLGEYRNGVITFDATANGAGWFIDPTPQDHGEFSLDANGQLVAAAGSPAFGRYDLLTVALHEIGHLLGFAHSGDEADLMSATLTPGTRRLPDFLGPSADATTLEQPATIAEADDSPVFLFESNDFDANDPQSGEEAEPVLLPLVQPKSTAFEDFVEDALVDVIDDSPGHLAFPPEDEDEQFHPDALFADFNGSLAEELLAV